MTRVGALRERFRRAVENSWVVRVSSRTEATLSRWASDSRILQWFLAEPEPEVVVIDLRETYTVGSLLRVGDHLAAGVRRFADSTGTTSTLEAVSHRFRAAPVRLLGTVLLAVALLGAGYTVTADASMRILGWWLVLASIALLATRECRSAEELDGTWIGQAFQPPEPPERRDEN